jgi:hypothetical protein
VGRRRKTKSQRTIPFVANVKVVPVQPGLVWFAVLGKNGSYPVAPSDLPLWAAMVLDARSGEGGEAGCARPAPTCTFNPSNNTLRCG